MIAKLRLVFSFSILFLSFYGVAQSTYWKNTELNGRAKQFSKQRLQVNKGKAFVLNQELFIQALTANKNSNVIYFPNEEGILIEFRVQEASVFSEKLAEKYPSIKSYKGVAVHDPTKQVRFSVSNKGIQSMTSVAGENGSLFMQKSVDDTYVLYRRTEQEKSDIDFVCRTMPSLMEYSQNNTAKLVDDQVLRTFRVAISASGEYTQFHGGTVIDALAAINASLTRINAIFERDLAITLELIDNTDLVIFTDPETDPYTGSLSAQVQNTLTNIIGEANYDIGHLFNQQDNTLDGNSGFIGAVCQDNRKGSGYTTLSSPVGDAFDIDLVAHEMGHQFGANHSFSHISEGTTVQVEPASGTTIMGYAGITGNNNVASNSDDYFHYVSVVQIRDYLQTISCGQTQVLTNSPPTLLPLSNYSIPKETPFVLVGEANDVDTTNVLSYSWEQIDNGIVTRSTFGPANPAGANFRSLPPSISPQRFFPKLNRILSGQLIQAAPSVDEAWETLSSIGREFNFSLTVRDNALNGGQSISDELMISVINDAGPFVVTSQNTEETFEAGSVQNITWDVANTNVAPINAETVSIYFSTDRGITFPTLLVENTVNDGNQSVIIPNLPTTTGRIMIKADTNIFFSVNSSNFTITPSDIVLNFNQVVFDVCKPNDISIPFTYETNIGFNEESTFSAIDLPTGLTANFSPISADTTNTNVTVDFVGISNLSEGEYPIKIIATSATASKEVTLQLRVYDAIFESVELTAPSNGMENVSKDVVLNWTNAIGNTLYDIEIATDISFATIIESATVSTDFYAPSLLENNSQYFWRLRPKNDCGEGVFGTAFSFSTIQFNCAVKEATALPITISSSGTPVISSKIVFYENLAVADLNVVLDIEHTFLADLVIKLTSPAGTAVTLVSGSCGEAQNILATFDDDSPSFNCFNNPGISGSVRPLGSLSAFNGESILGEWTLEIRDNAPSDGGRLNAFALEVCVEGDFRPDDDNDGVFDDGDDLCPGTLNGLEVDASGCPVYRFPEENFLVSLESETCRDNNDGSLTIIPKLALDYEVAITGNGINLSQNFSNSFILENLSSGTYTLCITGTDGTISYVEYCVEVQITEPAPLSVSSKIALDGSQITLEMEGSSIYTIELNGISIQTEKSSVVLDLEKGLNILKVFTNIPCQGIYEEEFGFFEKPIVFPNPVKDIVKVYLGSNQEKVLVRVFSVDGRWVFDESVLSQDGVVEIDLSSLSTGVYYLKYKSVKIKGTSKVVKE
ncbi:zinc-dependent metalloprotease [Maribacter hydrothermalis]|uniref:Proprotein convertase P n=1 Tax=Maribacter hydrothermalis TaxID=1836467 RepID=A0A1B7ZF36_9FLAO|nr:zinc-dependent metalloprotease family protein [Maribacter hydrothermalis]APQ17678.1 proprotein convertase P [Maribacter hydrothermalis]OBR42153.1 proprotein convertase P [Maribacter hydrothermalis]